VKLKPRRRRRRNELASTLIITSMVDMFTLVLLFLLVFYDPGFQGDDALELPRSQSTRAVEPGAVVRILPSGVLVGGRQVLALDAGALRAGTPMRDKGPTAVTEALTPLAAAAAEPEKAALQVECDRRVPWSALGPVLESAADAGFARYRFVVVGED